MMSKPLSSACGAALALLLTISGGSGMDAFGTGGLFVEQEEEDACPPEICPAEPDAEMEDDDMAPQAGEDLFGVRLLRVSAEGTRKAQFR